MKLKKSDLEKIKNFFTNKPEIAAVYLYGSFAKNKATKNSDIDLGVVFEKKELKPFASPEVGLAIELSNLLNRKTEVADLEQCQIDFSHRVISEGMLIYSQNEVKRIAFEEKILRDFFDLKPAFDEYYHYLSLITRKGKLNVRYT